MQTRVGMLSLGCARNLVDAEVILGYLKKAGFAISEEIIGSDVAIVNTCCFIREAEEESLNTIVDLCRLKKEGKIGKIIICGCLAERYKNELLGRFSEADGMIGLGSLDRVATVLRGLSKTKKKISRFSQAKFLYTHSSPRQFLAPRHFAYIKISDGCNNHCSYCIIPRLRGRYRSRPMGSIVKEAQLLCTKKRKVSEINLIAQDTTMYGKDLYRQTMLANLLKRLTQKASGQWIRLLYAHPAHFSQELLAVIRNEKAICKYIDLPLQHINDKILEKMNRRISRKQILSLIAALRKQIPNLAIRTTLIVGFPGETDKQFRQLLDFIQKTKFERLGIFKYSRQANTPAYNFVRQIPEKIKQARYDQALSLQQDISAEINEGFLGQELCVLVDEAIEGKDGNYLGRTQYDAPEVDGCVYLKSKKRLKIGDFVQAKITDTLEYDLVGQVIVD